MVCRNVLSPKSQKMVKQVERYRVLQGTGTRGNGAELFIDITVQSVSLPFQLNKVRALVTIINYRTAEC